MPILKAYETSDGFLNVPRKVRFLDAVDFTTVWGDTYFVDYDNGSDSNNGLSPAKAFKNIRYALTVAGEWDVIYVRPRDPDSTGGDPAHISPDTAANWIVPYTSHGLRIVGSGKGGHQAAAYQTSLTGYAALTTPTLWIKAPYVSLENLTIRRNASTAGALKISSTGASSDYSFAATVYGCVLWQVASAANGAIVIDSAWYTTIEKSVLKACYNGISIAATTSVPKGVVIQDADFLGLTTDVSADISSVGAVTSILITRCNFNHALPAAGAPNKYVNIGAASTGLISNSYFGVADATIANSLTLNGITNSHLWGMSAEIT